MIAMPRCVQNGRNAIARVLASTAEERARRLQFLVDTGTCSSLVDAHNVSSPFMRFCYSSTANALLPPALNPVLQILQRC